LSSKRSELDRTKTTSIPKEKAIKRLGAEKENREDEEPFADHIPNNEIMIIAKIAPRVALKITIKEPIAIPRNDTYLE
tara:strand:+ start:331 stop:564 length:234 start_codon:yes stop_codon:yes gene_type:complete